MAEFHVRSDAVDVEHIMRQIRQRIKEKRGIDYTEEELHQLARVKLEKFLDPGGVRSDLVQQFRLAHPPEPAPPNYQFEDTTLYETHRGFIRGIRKLLNPILKLFFNPNPIVDALHIQADLNRRNAQFQARQRAVEQLRYEVIHNLVVELTRAGIEIRNLKMRVDSLAGRLDFDERRQRAFEGVAQYRKPAQERSGGGPAQPAGGGAQPREGAAPGAEGEEGAQRSRRRRRRRRRVPSAGMPQGTNQQGGGAESQPQGGNGGGEPGGGPGGGEGSAA